MNASVEPIGAIFTAQQAAAVAASTAKLFREVANRSWQAQLIGRVEVAPSELTPPIAVLSHPEAVDLIADITLNYDWIETVYKTHFTRIDRCLTLAAQNFRRFNRFPLIFLADVTLLRVGEPHYGYGRECSERGVVAIAGNCRGYCPVGESSKDSASYAADVASAIRSLIVHLHQNRIHDYDYAGCDYKHRLHVVA